ncbi:MAG TPA: stage III sporulation protein AE [Firmicutes bacterium]|nr:stage III sporulation protein AE [Bacillota bacterium]HCX79744.1 stage III sporulation protein AE [Bacillota bacterium]
MTARVLGAAVLVAVLLLLPAAAVAQEQPVDTSELEQAWELLQEQYGNYLPEFSWQDLGATVDFRGLVSGLARYLFHQVWANASLLGQLVILAVLSALIKNLQSSFSSQGVAQVSRAVIIMVLLTMSAYSFSLAVNLARQTVQAMTGLIISLVPVMLTLLVALGSVTAATAFQPVLFTATALVGTVVSNIVLPLLFAAAVLAVVNQMVLGIEINKLAGLLKDLAVWLLGFLLTVFVGVTVINGAVAAVADGVALRTGKFAAKTLIPVVGGMFSDAFETVAGAALVLKSSIGLFGVIALVVSCFFPVLKLFAITLIYRGTAALLQPLGEDAVSDTLEIMARYMYAVIGAVAAVGLMFFMLITIMVAAANLPTMLR